MFICIFFAILSNVCEHSPSRNNTIFSKYFWRRNYRIKKNKFSKNPNTSYLYLFRSKLLTIFRISRELWKRSEGWGPFIIVLYLIWKYNSPSTVPDQYPFVFIVRRHITEQHFRLCTATSPPSVDGAVTAALEAVPAIGAVPVPFAALSSFSPVGGLVNAASPPASDAIFTAVEGLRFWLTRTWWKGKNQCKFKKGKERRYNVETQK